MKFAELGLLAKPTHGHIIRLAPPLVINDKQVEEAMDILEKGLRD
jgi:ornithine--oxo-acid transaminase